ncbi:RidA family protein [Leucobacter sp. CSA2]|uniref:RidA family protein n=1 Tax=Leucobacter edaphi TaxID=2796472 RepID=A0A934QEM5_9MICO|nr:RidA family protein [Leucobacter edaphi]MBK0422049.1 RidA family protein [Leucobacter edaphi]
MNLERRHANVPGHWQVPGRFQINHSHGIRVGDMIWVGGQEDLDENGNVRNPGDVVAQCHSVMQSLKAVIEDLGGTMGDVVQFNTFYAGELSFEEWQRTYDIRFGYFPEPGPTATGILIGEELNLPGIRVEVNAVAVVGSAAAKAAAGADSTEK